MNNDLSQIGNSFVSKRINQIKVLSFFSNFYFKKTYHNKNFTFITNVNFNSNI